MSSLYSDIEEIVEKSKSDILKLIKKDDYKNDYSIDQICLDSVPDFNSYYSRYISLENCSDYFTINNGNNPLYITNILKSNNVYTYYEEDNVLKKCSPSLKNIKIINIYNYNTNIWYGYDNYFNFIIYFLNNNNEVLYSYYLMKNKTVYPMICFYNNMNNYSELINYGNNRLLEKLKSHWKSFLEEKFNKENFNILIKDYFYKFYSKDKDIVEPLSTRNNLGIENYKNTYKYKIIQLNKFKEIFDNLINCLKNKQNAEYILKNNELNNLKKDKIYIDSLLVCIKKSLDDYKKRYKDTERKRKIVNNELEKIRTLYSYEKESMDIKNWILVFIITFLILLLFLNSEEVFGNLNYKYFIFKDNCLLKINNIYNNLKPITERLLNNSIIIIEDLYTYLLNLFKNIQFQDNYEYL